MRGKAFLSFFAALGVTVAASLTGCGGGGSAPAFSAVPAKNNAGTTVSFRAANFSSDVPQVYTMKATKMAEGAHCYVYLENGQTVSADRIQAIVDEFDNTIYPKDTATFGGEPNPGVDNDPKIYILLLDIRDGFNGTTNPGYIAGYFDPGDEYPVNIESSSNQKEMVYMDIYPASPGSAGFFNTLAHEFQHMIHWQQKDHLRNVSDDTWLNEGMSEIAAPYCGYGPSYSRVLTFEKSPTDSLVQWNSTLQDYGVVYLWSQYFKDRFENAVPNIFWDILHNDKTGISAVNYALAQVDPALTFSTTFQDWTIAIYSGSTVTWQDHPEWSYRSIDTWPGVHNGVVLPGLFPQSKQNPASPLAPLGMWSANYYSYTPITQPTGTLTWTAAAASEKAALIDPDPTIHPDLVSGGSYTFSTRGYLVLRNPASSGTGNGDTVTRTSIMESSAAIDQAGAVSKVNPGKTPKAMLDEANLDPEVRSRERVSGEGEAICIHDYLSRKEKMRRAGGAKPAF